MSEAIYNTCFACGQENEKGLKLKFSYDNNIAISEYVVAKDYEGYPNITHGGIVATILDEAMAKIILYKDVVAVTGEMTVKYRRALKVETPIKIYGEIIEQRSRTIKTRGKIEQDGKIIAEANATYIKVKK